MGYLVLIGISFILITIFISSKIEKYAIEGKRNYICGILFVLLWFAFLIGLFLSETIKENF